MATMTLVAAVWSTRSSAMSSTMDSRATRAMRALDGLAMFTARLLSLAFRLVSRGRPRILPRSFRVLRRLFVCLVVSWLIAFCIRKR